MKARKFLLGAVAAVMSLSIAPVAAAEVEVAAGADFVSSYVWRGADQGSGFSVQPGASVTVGGLTAGLWGSTSISSFEAKELDFYVAYEIGGLSIGFTDYWWEGTKDVGEINGGSDVRFFTTAGRTTHYGEVNLGYTFGEKFPLSLSANVFVYGGGDLNRAGDKQAYSSYFHAAYPFTLGGFDFEAGLGIAGSKYSGCYAGIDDNGVATSYSVVQDVSLGVSYDVKVTDTFSIPLFVDTIFSPATDDAFIVFGFSLNM